MTLYADIGAAVLGVVPDFTVGGPSWTRTRTTAHTPTTDGTTSTATITLYVVEGSKARMRGATTGMPVLDSSWLGFGASSVSLQAGDKITDGTYTFLVTGAPQTYSGFLMAPMEQQG